MDWMDCEESQKHLDFQRHSWDDFHSAFQDRMRFHRWALTPLRPMIRRLLIHLSNALLLGLVRLNVDVGLEQVIHQLRVTNQWDDGTKLTAVRTYSGDVNSGDLDCIHSTGTHLPHE